MKICGFIRKKVTSSKEIFDAYSQDVLTKFERVDSALVPQPGRGAEFADVQEPGRMEAAWWLKANWDSWE